MNKDINYNEKKRDILKLCPEAQQYQRRSNPYLAKMLGRLESDLLLQIDYYLSISTFRFYNSIYIAMSFDRIAEDFCGTVSVRSIKQAMSNLMECGIIEKVPVSSKHHGVNCYRINYSMFYAICEEFKNGIRPPAIPDKESGNGQMKKYRERLKKSNNVVQKLHLCSAESALQKSM
jgi:predicted transcriptional regulator